MHQYKHDIYIQYKCLLIFYNSHFITYLERNCMKMLYWNNFVFWVLIEKKTTYKTKLLYVIVPQFWVLFFFFEEEEIRLLTLSWRYFLNIYPKGHLYIILGPVVQSIVSLMSSLRLILCTVLADSVYNILIFFALQKLLTFFQQKLQHICVSLDVNFNESLTNNVVSFEQLGPGPEIWTTPFYYLLMFLKFC